MAITNLTSADTIGTMVRLFVWTGIPNGNTGQAIEIVDFADLTVTLEGTFSTGGSVTLEGSNNGTNYYPLTDPQGNAITKTTAGVETVTETPRFIRPSVTAGDGSTAIDVRLLARRGSR